MIPAVPYEVVLDLSLIITKVLLIRNTSVLLYLYQVQHEVLQDSSEYENLTGLQLQAASTTPHQ